MQEMQETPTNPMKTPKQADAGTAQSCQHTPGPWLDCGAGTLQHPVTSASITTRVVQTGKWGRIGEWHDYSNEPEENFRLITAAPELLAALKRIDDICARNWKGLDASLPVFAIREVALGAIAKARGQAT